MRNDGDHRPQREQAPRETLQYFVRPEKNRNKDRYRHNAGDKALQVVMPGFQEEVLQPFLKFVERHRNVISLVFLPDFAWILLRRPCTHHCPPS